MAKLDKKQLQVCMLLIRYFNLSDCVNMRCVNMWMGAGGGGGGGGVKSNQA